MKRFRTRHRNRAGYVLVLLLLMLFGLLGLAALVIDMGFARLAQRQMQTAVDSAALEGLRWRDAKQWEDLPQGWLVDPDFRKEVGVPGTGPLSPQQRDLIRRWAASKSVANLFADYVDSAGTVQNGAGPVVDFTGGVGPPSAAAGQNITWPPPPPYQPALELNYPENAPYGDMTSGTYGLNPNYDPTQLADEDANYDRRDFIYSSGTADSASAPAFLVRTRRTNNPNNINPLDNAAGISSSGPTLPILFGRGSLMARSGSGSQLSVSSGITVRATAIAAASDGIQFGGAPYNAGRAKTAGQPCQYTDPTSSTLASLPGVTPFALTRTFWQSSSGSTQVTVTSAGVLILTTSEGATIVGQAIQSAGILQIGQQVGGSVSIASSGAIASACSSPFYGPPNLYQYVPIYDTIAGANTIIGFGYLSQWSLQPGTGIPPLPQLSLTLQPSGSQPVGFGNISGAFIPGLPQDTSDYTDLFAAHASFTGGSVYAPVLVNRYIGPTNP